jgi:hypothetical protein
MRTSLATRIAAATGDESCLSARCGTHAALTPAGTSPGLVVPARGEGGTLPPLTLGPGIDVDPDRRAGLSPGRQLATGVLHGVDHGFTLPWPVLLDSF